MRRYDDAIAAAHAGAGAEWCPAQPGESLTSSSPAPCRSSLLRDVQGSHHAGVDLAVVAETTGRRHGNGVAGRSRRDVAGVEGAPIRTRRVRDAVGVAPGHRL